MSSHPARTSKVRRPAPLGSLGPVADLESHLPEEWWRKLFNALYVKTDGDVVENADNTRNEVDIVLRSLNLQPQDHILDLCCGQGRHALELARRGFHNITGVDRSRYLIRLARKRASAERLTVSFREGDARRPRLPDSSLDAVCILGNSFGYFSKKRDDEKVLKSVSNLLKPSGVLFLDLAEGAWIRANFEQRSWEWIDEHHFVCRERSLAADGERLISREVVVHDETGVLADQFYAERLYTRDSMQMLLDQLGYRNVRHHDDISSLSSRQQDLGMMARRMIITADAPPKAVKSKGRPKPLNVAVLMGDPRLPDNIKRDGQFNSEDLETVRILKEALESLPGYRFRYVDNHATMERYLKSQPTDLIFNLCDEGFNNDPFKELHVPALIEMLHVPYTGAAPRCLAACYDKGLVRAVAVQLDIPVPLETYIRRGDQGATLPSVFPALLKPNFGDSSEGITQDAVVSDERALINYLDSLHTNFPNRPVLVQEFLSGAEYSVGLIGNVDMNLKALPLLEVDYSGLDPKLPKILGYESKWLPDSPYWTGIKYRESTLSDREQSNLIDYSMRLFDRLGCRDYARFDYRADAKGDIKLLEVNPNPGWCWDGKLNLMASFADMTYTDLLEAILVSAEERLGLEKKRTRADRKIITAAVA
jgi:D-alanine-D-alanine ligase